MLSPDDLQHVSTDALWEIHADVITELERRGEDPFAPTSEQQKDTEE